MDWPARSPDLNTIEYVWDFSRQTCGSSYLTTSNDSGSTIGAARRAGQQCLNNSLTASFSAWADAVKPLDVKQDARRNRRQTAGEIARHTTQATGRPISRFTVARRLHGGGLIARRPVRCVPLTPAHQRRRSLWCREHRNWRDNEWDEYYLQMRADSV
ncbi:transposable element Tcb1 transposase [Trichonephila clavipes]|uniref:Transposable element Tcb1 transposase n=1 Tax=Trichonephila clavipes TaxID=2585209 RepID=A0A8X6R740_TRICX|nr:transposable element Tcb1 transposase [Trichonephila clavipes]